MKKYTGLLVVAVTWMLSILIGAGLIKPRPAKPLLLPQAEATYGMAEMTAFEKMASVLTHKRCVNCHPSGDEPRQGEDSHLHRFGVKRGVEGRGTVALKCYSCHQAENNDYAGVPGAPDWHLAPKSMAWEGLTGIEIAKSMMDKTQNGGRSPEEVMHHLTEHPLVLWAWDPGVDPDGNPREKPPVSKDEYIAAVKEWISQGAIIPEE